MSGLFITIEGMDGAGKSTQIKLLEQYLKSSGFNVTSVREPGGTLISEKIRNILLDHNNQKMSFITETLLYSASRSQLVTEVILPNLKKGDIVLCDRFIDSNLVYQGFARKVGIENVQNINKIALNGLSPDITFFLSIPPEEAFSRKKSLGNLDRIEREKFEFYKKIYDGYIKISQIYFDRIFIIDATQNINNVSKMIVNALNKFLEQNALF